MLRYLRVAGLIAALAVVLLPTSALAQEFGFSISPYEVHVDNLPPGATSEFELTIHNKEELAHNFTLSTFQPSEGERREGRTEFPDDGWISFSSREIEVAANAETAVNVTVAVPREPEWAGKEWEIWLVVTAESRDILTVQLYTRLLVSTAPGVDAGPNAKLVAGIVVGIVLAGCGGYYYYRRRTRSERL